MNEMKKVTGLFAVVILSLAACTEYSNKLPGDLNGDGHLTDADLLMLQELINEGSSDSSGDLNKDGKLDEKDLSLLKEWLCEVNGAAIDEEGDCCITLNDDTVCCDANFDGDFNDCQPPDTDCQDDQDCDILNCPAYCDQQGKCRCQGMCDDDEDCIFLNCPAYCNTNGECECKIFCETDLDCGFISQCPSICGPEGYCLCAEECLGQGESFEGEPEGGECCPGLGPIEYAEYHQGECLFVDCLCWICAACGDGQCLIGENPCNCPEDCGECIPGDERLYLCPDGVRVPWCTCGDDGSWACIQTPENQCQSMTCLPGEERDYTCPDGEEVFWCECDNMGTWQCIDSPENQCTQDPCEGVTCPVGHHCVNGRCYPDTCLGEGEEFEDFDTEGKCCAGLVPIQVAVPEENTCVTPNCPCFVCARCGTDMGVCSLGENRCNCPEDCVTSHDCSSDDCMNVAGSYAISGDCPGIPTGMDMYAVYQERSCGPMEAELAGGMCDTFWGYKWDGAQCVYLGGRCECLGADCDNLFMDQYECEWNYSHCLQGEPCDPMDASIDDPSCDFPWGYKWDGFQCVDLGSGCDCVGADCDRLPMSQAECQAAHAHCVAQGCKLLFDDVLGFLLGQTGCIDHNMIYTGMGCVGGAHQIANSTSMYFTCPYGNSQGTREDCSIYLDDMID